MSQPGENKWLKKTPLNKFQDKIELSSCSSCFGTGQCIACGDISGRCSRCYGMGCEACKGTGKCQFCSGTAKCSVCGGSGEEKEEEANDGP